MKKIEWPDIRETKNSDNENQYGIWLMTYFTSDTGISAMHNKSPLKSLKWNQRQAQSKIKTKNTKIAEKVRESVQSQKERGEREKKIDYRLH